VSPTAGSYTEILAERIHAERVKLSLTWLERLKAMLPVEANEVFPTDKLLDHIPMLLVEIARYLRAPEAEEIAANAAVIDKARELGQLRHEQKASVHQILREYELLAEILENFVAAETTRLNLDPSSSVCLDAVRKLTRSVRMLMRTTVDTFVSEYTATIEAQTEQLRSFNRMASHELRSPVGTILVAASLMSREDIRNDAARLDRIASTIKANAERLTVLLTTLQRVAHLDAPIDAPASQVVHVASIAGEVARQLRDMAHSRQVSLRVDPNLPVLLVDPGRLELSLLNLVSNGIKYSDPAKPDRFVEIRLDGHSESTCTISVRDNGLGIPDESKPEVFKRFFRAHAELDTWLGVDGTGLGLAIVAECVQAMGGAITCESRVGEGTTFCLELPVK
jgi:signal transduction histidine kinase